MRRVALTALLVVAVLCTGAESASGQTQVVSYPEPSIDGPRRAFLVGEFQSGFALDGRYLLLTRLDGTKVFYDSKTRGLRRAALPSDCVTRDMYRGMALVECGSSYRPLLYRIGDDAPRVAPGPVDASDTYDEIGRYWMAGENNDGPFDPSVSWVYLNWRTGERLECDDLTGRCCSSPPARRRCIREGPGLDLDSPRPARSRLLERLENEEGLFFSSGGLDLWKVIVRYRTSLELSDRAGRRTLLERRLGTWLFGGLVGGRVLWVPRRGATVLIRGYGVRAARRLTWRVHQSGPQDEVYPYASPLLTRYQALFTVPLAARCDPSSCSPIPTQVRLYGLNWPIRGR